MATDVGRVRSSNEDSLAAFPPGIFVVADGMGGHAAGEVASRLLIRTVHERLRGSERAPGEQELRAAIEDANEKILARAENIPAYQGMGTTATLFSIAEGGALSYAHVGDSRFYILRDGNFSQVTHDHSYVEKLVEEGEITKEEARSHPQKNVLLRAVGTEETIEVDTGSFTLEAGDVLLLASDGLMNMVRDEGIQLVLSGSEEDKAESLVKKAVEAGGKDNVTAIVVEYAP